MKNLRFCEARITLYDIFSPKRMHKLWKSRGLKRIIYSPLVLFINILWIMYTLLATLICSSLCCFKNCSFICAAWTPPKVFNTTIILNLIYLFLWIWNIVHFFFREMNNYILEILGWKYQLHIFHVMHIFL